MAFMSTYFKKKNNDSSWNNNPKKRTYDDVNKAVKKLKILVESDQNKSKKSKLDDSLIENVKTNFPSFQVQHVSFLSKRLAGCLCQCSEDGISIFLEEAVTSNSCIALKFTEVVWISKELLLDRLVLCVTKEKVDDLKKTFQTEPWRHCDFTDSDGHKLRIGISKCEKQKAVNDFYEHVLKSLKPVLHLQQSSLSSPSSTPKKPENDRKEPAVHPKKSEIDDGKSEIDSGIHDSSVAALEINVASFYGSSKDKTTTTMQKKTSVVRDNDPECVMDLDVTDRNGTEVLIEDDDDDVTLEETPERQPSREVIECVKSVADEDDVEEETENEVSIFEVENEKRETRNNSSSNNKKKKKTKQMEEREERRAKCSKCNREFDRGDGSRGGRCPDCRMERKKGKVRPVRDLDLLRTKEPVRLFEYPPPPSVGRITFTSHDLACLAPEEFFNDVNIDFYLKFFHQEILSETDRRRTHIFSSFFYSHLTSVKGDSREKRYNRVKTWTRNIDLFSKDFVIVPINQNYHWFLSIICFPGLCENWQDVNGNPNDRSEDKSKSKSSASKNKASCGKSDALDLIAGYGNSSSDNDDDDNEEKTKTPQNLENGSPDVIKRPLILILDSLAGGKPRWDITSVLREYLQAEWNERKQRKDGDQIFTKKSVVGCVPRCPQQSNHYDCGPYLLLCVQRFFMTPIKNFSPPIKNLKNWFSGEEADHFRTELKDLVEKLSKKEGSPAETAEDARTDFLEIL